MRQRAIVASDRTGGESVFLEQFLSSWDEVRAHYSIRR